MGNVSKIVFGLLTVLAFVLFSATLFSVAVTQGGFATVDFPLTDEINRFQNSSQEFRDEFSQSVQESQTTDPSVEFGADSLLAGSAIVKSFVFTFEALQLLISMAESGFNSIASEFGLEPWILAIGITALTLSFVFGMIGVIMRADI